MTIDFESWLDTKNWANRGKYQPKGVEVIDKCLASSSKVMASNKESPKKLSPRKKYPNSKYKEFVVNAPSGYCPKCHKYIPETGVVCVKCNAFWHYECANVTQVELDEQWHNIDFLCEDHREEKAIDEVEASKMVSRADHDAFDDENLLVRTIKIKSYELNTKYVLKKKLASLESPAVYEPKDSNRQHTVTMSTPTYHIMLENMIHCGKSIGLTIKRDDKDKRGNSVESSFNAEVTMADDTVVPFTVICYHTTNKMLFQLLGAKTEPKINGLTAFVNQVMRKNVESVERTELHRELQIAMKCELENLLTDTSSNSFYIPTDQTSKIKTIEIAKETESVNTTTFEKSDISSKPVVTVADEMEKAESKSLHVETINALKLQLDEGHKERRKLNQEKDELSKKVKEAEVKDKSIKSLNEKLEKTTKLKEQMTAAVQTLKQEKEVSMAQIETHKSTIESQNETVESFRVIIQNFESKMSEKDEIIRELGEKLRQNEIGINLHKEVAVRFMDEMNGISEDSDVDEEEEYKKEMKKIYAKLREEELKSKNLEQDSTELKKQFEVMKLELEKAEATNKHIREVEMVKQNKEHAVAVDNLKKSKKEIKMLKDTMSENEKDLNTQAHEIKMLKQHIADDSFKKQVKKLTSPRGTEELAKLLQDKETQIEDLKEHSQFVQKELEEKMAENEVILSQLKDLQVQNAEATKREAEIKQQMALSQVERDDAQNRYLASKHENSQLVNLNYQLKSTNDKIKQKGENQCERPVSKACGEISHGEATSNTVTSQDKTPQPSNSNASMESKIMTQRYCYNELRAVGSCPRGKQNCRFNHSIPQEIISDKERILCIVGAKNLCVNEYVRKGSCNKGERCRFHHVITNEQLNNPALQDIMKSKLEKMKGHAEEHKQDQYPRLCVHEYHQEGSCSWKDRCKFSHDISEEQRKNINTKNQMAALSSKMNASRNPPRRGENVVVPLNMLEQMWKQLEHITKSMNF